MAPVVIRRATTADLPHLGRLGALLVAAHHNFDSRRFLTPSDRTSSSYACFLSTQLEEPDACVFVALNKEEVIGYAYGTVEGSDWMSLRGPAGVVQDLIIDPRYRRKGVGWLLLETTFAYLKSRGMPRVVLSTAERNEAGQHLFANMGFRRTMVEMTRELDEPSR